MHIWIDNPVKRHHYLGDFLGMVPVLKKLGSDKLFIRYIQTLPSCLSGIFEEYVGGDGRSIAAHVRRASNSGTGYKPPYSCVPLTNDEHCKQHQHGESYHRPKHWWDSQRDHYRQRWATLRLKQKLKLTGEVEEDMELIREWVIKQGLEREFMVRAVEE